MSFFRTRPKTILIVNHESLQKVKESVKTSDLAPRGCDLNKVMLGTCPASETKEFQISRHVPLFSPTPPSPNNPKNLLFHNVGRPHPSSTISQSMDKTRMVNTFLHFNCDKKNV